MLIIEIEATFSYCQLFSPFPVEQTEIEFYWDKWRWNRRVVESGYMPANTRDDHHCLKILMGSVLRAKELQEALQACRQGWERPLRPVPPITCITCLLVSWGPSGGVCSVCYWGMSMRHCSPSWPRGKGLPGWLRGRESPCQCRRHGFDPWSGKIPLRKWQTHCSIVAWRTPWTEEPGLLQSMGSQRVGHDLATEQ